MVIEIALAAFRRAAAQSPASKLSCCNALQVVIEIKADSKLAGPNVYS
jgi:hypothetical protein